MQVPGEGNTSLYLPSGNGSHGWDSCSAYRDPSNHSAGRGECGAGYTFHFQGETEWSVTAEWSLVCDRAYLGTHRVFRLLSRKPAEYFQTIIACTSAAGPLLTTVYFCGVMLGGVIFGSLSDRWGRKWVMLLCLYSQCIIGISLHFVSRLVVFMGLRFVQGIAIQGLQCVTYSMIMELFSPAYRTLAGCVAEGFWAGGIIVLALIAKYVQHWRYIQLAINIPTLATLLYIWIIPESLRWLLSKGKVKQAETVANSIIAYNSLKLEPGSLRLEMEAVSRDLVSRQDARRPPDITDIMRVPGLRARAFTLAFVWFSVSLCYYGIAYYVPNLFGDRHLNFVLGGGIELAAYLLSFVVLGGFGRRGPLCVYLGLSGALCISMVLLGSFLDPATVNVPAVLTALALLGKATIVSCFCIIFLYSSEVFPTVIRSVGVGCCTLFGRVGSLLAPQVLLAGELISPATPGLAPFLTFGLLCLLAALLTLSLPETLNTKLPDTIEEAVAQAGRGGDAATGPGLDVGYGKCPDFVCTVDGLIVSQDQEKGGPGWTDCDSQPGSTLSTLRSAGGEAGCLEEGGEGGAAVTPGIFSNLVSFPGRAAGRSYQEILKTNESLLESHMAVGAGLGRRGSGAGGSEGGGSTASSGAGRAETHTSQVGTLVY